MKVRLADAVAVLAIAGSIAVAAGYDSNGFEPPTFAPGSLNGQGGWTEFVSGGGTSPQVVTAPDPVEGTQAVRLEVGDTHADYSEMDHAFSITPGPDTILTVSFDIYRIAPAEGLRIQNLWWYWYEYDALSTPGYGIQWDSSVATHPFGFGASSPTVFGQWANLTMTWDFTSMTATASYNGAAVVPPTAFTWDGRPFTGYGIYLAHDSDTGTGGDVAWIDNFVITVLPVVGDTNCDGVVNFDDINPFVTALVSQQSYETQYPNCRWLNADVDGNSTVNFDDINPFVACLVAGGCP